MHEISLMSDIMRIATEELARHGGRRLTLVRVRYGVLNQIVPDAMSMACGNEFAATSRETLFHPCPLCGQSTGFECCAGDGIFLDHLEAE